MRVAVGVGCKEHTVEVLRQPAWLVQSGHWSHTNWSRFLFCEGFGVGVWVWLVGWLLLENCIVDASIQACDALLGVLWVGFCDFVLLKFLSAQGGCLGIRSRRRTL